MSNSYSSSLRLTLQRTGENAGTWGDVTNNNLGILLEQAIAGVQSITITGNITLSTNNGLSDQARNAAIVFIGTLASNAVVTFPSVPKLYAISNSTTGGYSLTLGTSSSSGTTVMVPNGATVFVVCDGTNVTDINTLYTPSITGTVAREVSDKLQERLSVKDFGAKGDGTTDDTVAFKNALTYVGNNGASLYIPKGVYILNDSSGLLSISISTSLGLFGDGNTSVLKFTGSKGIKLTATTGYESVTVSNLWFQAGYAGTDFGISFTRAYSMISGQSRYFFIENTFFSASDVNLSSYYFVTGIYLSNCPHSVIDKVLILGKAGNIVVCQKGIFLDNFCTDTHILSTRVYFAETALYVGSTQAYSEHSEGIIVLDPIFVYCNKGINIDQNVSQPGHRIINGHINTFTYCIRLSGSISSIIKGMLLYKQPTSTNSYKDIIFNGVANSIIEGIVTGGGALASVGTDTAITLEDYSYYVVGSTYTSTTPSTQTAKILIVAGLGTVVACPSTSTNYYSLAGAPIYTSPSTTPNSSPNITPAPLSTVGSVNNLISNCQIAVRNQSIYLGNSLSIGAQSNVIRDIRALSPKLPYTEIVEASGLNNKNYVSSLLAYRYENLTLNQSQSIPNSTATAVTWDLSASGALAGTQDLSIFPDVFVSSANPTRLVINSFHINAVTLTAGVQWVSNGTGTRALEIRKNGVTLVGTAPVNGLSGVLINQNVVSSIQMVSPGDYFEVFVTQTSGGSLNINLGQFTFFQITQAPRN